VTAWSLVLVAVAGGVGAALRFFLDGLITARTRTAFPYGTAVINLSGSFALGLITGLATQGWLPDELALVLGVGLLGGYTTFSTASVETVRLARIRRYWAATANGLGVLIACVAAAGLGLWIASLC
jgi:CrcB protein